MNTPISFEIAQLLKEKGFDIPTFYYYENEKLIEPYLENGSSTDTEFRVDLSDLKEHFNNWSKKVSAPTITEVIMWLYEKYGIWIEVYLDDDTTFGYLISKVTNEGRVDFPLQRGFSSPTGAYETAIKCTLENLI
jgi:hypothetical protein